MKKKICLLGISMVVLFLFCAVTVQASFLIENVEEKSTSGQIGDEIGKKGADDQVEENAGKDGVDDRIEEGSGKSSVDNQPEENGGEDNEDGGEDSLPGENEEPKPVKPSVKPVEAMLMPEIQYPEIDGKNGYYKSYPEIHIIHREPEAMTKYELIAADGSKKQGYLELKGGTEESIHFSGDSLKDGENILHVSMERKEIKAPDNTEEPDGTDDSEKAEGSDGTDGLKKKSVSSKEEMTDENESKGEAEKVVFTKEIHFLVDTKRPENIRFFYNQASDKGTICINEPLEISLKSEDTGSGMEAIHYQTSDGTAGVLPGENGKIVLHPGFRGSIQAYAVDKAGNQSESAASEIILCENGAPEIFIRAQDNGELWHSGPVKVHVDVSDSGLSSGIRSLKCYIAGTVTVQEENAFSAGVTSMQADFVVDIPSEGGNGIPVVAEAVDWAGNYHTENILLHIDNSAPVIQSEGVHDKMITGENVKGRFTFREENVLVYRKMEMWKIDSDKGKEQLDKKEEQGSVTTLSDVGWDISIEEDGVYEIYVTAKDLAGHKSEQHYQITIDKTNPVIRYVDQMQGVYVPYFQWNYGKEEVVQDSTDYSYAIRLDGTFYNTGTRIADEGARVLQVEAVDAAGNKSTAEAVFQIDHTPPKIRIYDVQDGISYEEMAAVSISVDGKGEYLKGITVNSEKKRLETGCQIFRQTFQEPGDYRIRVLAEDLAGNQESEQVTFRIEEQKRMSGNVWKPVTKVFRNDNVTASSQKAAEENAEEPNRQAVLCLAICLGVVVLAAVFRQWWVRRERKG